MNDCRQSSPRTPETPSREDLLFRIQNPQVRTLLETAVEKIALTRSSGRTAESVVGSFLTKALQFEEWKIGAAISKYLEREYWLDGKGERYLGSGRIQ